VGANVAKHVYIENNVINRKDVRDWKKRREGE